MSFHNDIMAACRGRDSNDALSALQKFHGRHTTAAVAEAAGISTRQALRYMKGEVKNESVDVLRAIENAATDGMYAAEALAEAQFLDCGDVDVEYNGDSAGKRTIGRLTVTGEMRDTLEKAGEAYAEGDDERGDALMSVAILGGYCQSKGGGYDDLADEFGTVLDVSGFRGRFSLT